MLNFFEDHLYLEKGLRTHCVTPLSCSRNVKSQNPENPREQEPFSRADSFAKLLRTALSLPVVVFQETLVPELG